MLPFDGRLLPEPHPLMVYGIPGVIVCHIPFPPLWPGHITITLAVVDELSVRE